MPRNDHHAWNQAHHDLMTPLTVIAGRAQLMQRQLLRAGGLTTHERERLLGSVTAVLGAARLLEARIGPLLSPTEPDPRERAGPPPTE